MRVLLLKQILLTPEVVVQNDLLLEVVHHLVADLVGFIDSLGDRSMSGGELVQGLHLLL